MPTAAKAHRATTGDVIGHDALIAGWYGADLIALERSTLCPIPLEMLAELCASLRTKH